MGSAGMRSPGHARMCFDIYLWGQSRPSSTWVGLLPYLFPTKTLSLPRDSLNAVRNKYIPSGSLQPGFVCFCRMRVILVVDDSILREWHCVFSTASHPEVRNVSLLSYWLIVWTSQSPPIRPFYFLVHTVSRESSLIDTDYTWVELLHLPCAACYAKPFHSGGSSLRADTINPPHEAGNSADKGEWALESRSQEMVAASGSPGVPSNLHSVPLHQSSPKMVESSEWHTSSLICRAPSFLQQRKIIRMAKQFTFRLRYRTLCYKEEGSVACDEKLHLNIFIGLSVLTRGTKTSKNRIQLLALTPVNILQRWRHGG